MSPVPTPATLLGMRETHRFRRSGEKMGFLILAGFKGSVENRFSQ